MFGNKFTEHEIGASSAIPLNKLKDVNGTFNYVVLDGDKLIVGKKFDAPGGGHIDLANGQPVSAAGEVKVVQGNIKYIDNSSGHYEPSGASAQSTAERTFSNLGFDGKRSINPILSPKIQSS